MDSDAVVFWIVAFSCLAGFVVSLVRIRRGAAGWAGLYGVILLLTGAGWLSERRLLLYLGAGLWVALILLPGAIARLIQRSLLQERYATAGFLARVLGLLHPSAAGRDQPRIVRAMALAQRGRVAEALECLKPLEGQPSLIGLSAIVAHFRITQQWEELLAWEAQHGFILEQQTPFLIALLRAHGEVGDLSGLVSLYQRHQEQIGKRLAAQHRDLCRLALFAYCGRIEPVQALLDGSLAPMPAATREFWLATVEAAAGFLEASRRRLETLLPAANPPLRLAIERRLSRLSSPAQPADAETARVLEAAGVEHAQDTRFGSERSLFTRRALTTQVLIGLNFLMFAVEMALGGATDPAALERLGALVPAAVHAGQWWRLVGSLFLHFGTLHLVMNMLALGWLGPFVEFTLGWGRFLFVYLLAGVGSMSVVLAVASASAGEQATVGASGCIMGLIGATGALMLRGWVRERALSAKRRLIAVFIIVGTQTLFDAVVPQVSMTAHLSGVVIGFLATLALPDRSPSTKTARFPHSGDMANR